MTAPHPYHYVSETNRVEIVSRRARGDTFEVISRDLHVNINTVQKVVSKYQRSGIITDLPRSGRPHKLDNMDRRHLVRLVQSDDITTSAGLAQFASTQLDVHVCPRTIRNMLHAEGLHARHTIPKPLLNAAHKRERFEFAQAHAHWTVGNWKQVIFSDESLITAYAVHPHSWVWTKRCEGLNPRLIVPAVQGGGSRIMVWGCITKYGFHDLVRLEGIVDSEAYITALTDHLLPVIQQYFRGQQYVFQQDGSSIHTSHATTTFLNSQHIRVLQWPPHSPDVNIIEHVWHYLKAEIYKLEAARTPTQLWDKANQVMRIMWSQEMTNRITNLYESMPRRIQAIIAARGGNTEY